MYFQNEIKNTCNKVKKVNKVNILQFQKNRSYSSNCMVLPMV